MVHQCNSTERVLGEDYLLAVLCPQSSSWAWKVNPSYIYQRGECLGRALVSFGSMVREGGFDWSTESARQQNSLRKWLCVFPERIPRLFCTHFLLLNKSWQSDRLLVAFQAVATKGVAFGSLFHYPICLTVPQWWWDLWSDTGMNWCNAMEN